MSFEIINNNRADIERRTEDAIERALTMVGLVAEGDIQRVTPVDTGNLRNSITNVVHASGEEPYIEVGTAVEYAPYLEYGTSKMKATNGGKGYFRLALPLNQGKYEDIIAQELKKI